MKCYLSVNLVHPSTISTDIDSSHCWLFKLFVRLDTYIDLNLVIYYYDKTHTYLKTYYARHMTIINNTKKHEKHLFALIVTRKGTLDNVKFLNTFWVLIHRQFGSFSIFINNLFQHTKLLLSFVFVDLLEGYI